MNLARLFRTSRRARWGYPLLQFGGLSVWSRNSAGEIHLLGYHPRGRLTWHWYIGITNRQRSIFSRQQRDHRALLFVTGNPFVSMPRWWHSFIQFAAQRRGQWHDYIRLPFRRAICIGRQDYHRSGK